MRAEETDDVGKVIRSDGEVEEAVALGAELGVEPGEEGLEGLIARWIVEVHGVIRDFFDEGIEGRVVFVDAAAGDDAVLHVGRKGFYEVATGYADDSHLVRQETFLLEVVKGRQELALGEIAGGSEDDDDAWVGLMFGVGGGDFGVWHDVFPSKKAIVWRLKHHSRRATLGSLRE